MANNVLIQFSADTGGLDEANAKLQALSDREQELIQKVQQLKKEQQAAQLGAKNAEAQTKATQEYGKKIVEARNEINKTRKSIDELSEAQKELEKTLPAEAINQSFRTMLRNIREQIAMMELMGDTGSQEYERLVAEAGRLADIQGDVNRQINNIASDTRGFDTILEATQLASGGFSVLTGTMSLFGSENKDVQQMMLKLQSLIAINTGLQQVQNAVQKESNLMMSLASIQLKAKAAAEAMSTKGTVGATIAQKAFNLVAYANPYVLLAMALITVVGALYLFSRNTETAADKQKRLNELQREAIDIKDMYADSVKIQGEQRVRELERELELMQAQGRSEAQLALKRKQLNDERVKNALESYNIYSEEANSIDENINKAEEYIDALNELNLKMQRNNWKSDTSIKFNIDGETIKAEADKVREKIQGKLDLVNLNISRGIDANKIADEATHKREIEEIESTKRAAEAGKRSAVALAEYKVLIAKKGSLEELNAQIVAAEAKKQVAVQAENITRGERLKTIKETELQIQQLRDDYNKKQLQDELELINAGLSLSKEGSVQEYNLNINRLDKLKELELYDKNLTTNQKLAIENKYKKDVEKLTDDYLNHIAETEINSSISLIKERLAIVKEGSQEEFDLRIELARATADLERQNVENTVKDEMLKASRIKEINANLQKELSDLYSNKDTSRIKNHADKEILDTMYLYERGIISKREYDDTIRNISIDSIQKEIDARRKYGEDTIDLEKELSERRIEIYEEEKEARQAMVEELFNTISTFNNLSFDNKKARLQQEMDDLNHFYTTDAEAAKKNKDLKLISEEELQRKQLEIKRKQAKVEKEQALFNLFLTSGQAVARAFKDYPFPYSLLIAGLVGIQTLYQYNAVQSKQPPRYWKGRKGGKGEYALIGEYGAELMYIPEGASIMPANDSTKAMNGDKSVFSKWDMPIMDPKLPVSPSISNNLINQAIYSHKLEIDYEKMGRYIAKYSRKSTPANVNVSFDKYGLSVTNGNTTTNYSNSRGHV